MCLKRFQWEIRYHYASSLRLIAYAVINNESVFAGSMKVVTLKIRMLIDVLCLKQRENVVNNESAFAGSMKEFLK